MAASRVPGGKERRSYRREHQRLVWRRRWYRWRNSGFFPSLVAISVALVAAFAAHNFETRYWSDWCATGAIRERWCDVSLGLAVQIHAGVALALLGTVGVVFSIMLVSLQLISSQFSPRLVQAIFRDSWSKNLIAVLVGVFVYAMAALFSAVVLGGENTTPGLTTLGTLLAGLLAGTLLVWMLYRVAHRQYIGEILERTAKDTIRMLSQQMRRYEARHLTSHMPRELLLDVEAHFPGELGRPKQVRADRSGWVQEINAGPLAHVAPAHCVIRLETRVGAYVGEGLPIASIWPVLSSGRSELTEVERDHLDADMGLSFYIGTARTMHDDVDFGLRQVTDVLLRALSSAINDPSTAVEALLRSGTILRAIIAANLPPQLIHAEEKDILLLRPWDLDAAEYIRHALDQPRLLAPAHPSVAIAMLRTIVNLEELVEHESRRLSDAGDIRDAARDERVHHLTIAGEELVKQRQLLVEAINSHEYSEPDRNYIMSGLAQQNLAGA